MTESKSVQRRMEIQLRARIAELEAEVERLLARLRVSCDALSQVYSAERETVERLREENEALKRSLRQAEQLLGDFPDAALEEEA